MRYIKATTSTLFITQYEQPRGVSARFNNTHAAAAVIRRATTQPARFPTIAFYQ